MPAEIKFRAWDDTYKKMYYPTTNLFVDWDKHYGSKLLCEIASLDGKRDLSDSNYSIMQFTGLKDKNGDNIYEGDIIDASHFRPLIVGFCKESASFGACRDINMVIDKMFWFHNDIVLDQDDWYIVGNIFQNPDLI